MYQPMDERPLGSERRPPWVDAELFPFTSRFVDVHGHTVHYVDEGAGPTLLMLHGNPTWSFVYREVISRLSGRFRCVACDYPGFGLSTAAHGYGYSPEEHARVVTELVEQLDLRDVTLVMQDWGGPIGVHAAAAHPDRVAALVVANTWAWPVNGDAHFEVFSRVMGGPVGRMAIRRLNLFVNAMLPAGHKLRKLSSAEMAHYRAALPDPAARHASAVLPNAITAARDFLATVDSELTALRQLPALVLWADRDPAFRAAERERWQRRLPDHTTVTIPGAGHYVQSDAPGPFADAIAGWFGHGS
ncbi:alpha/beta fold hydrolase [Haloechinothrix alba]|nr:alpha/beta fold hydrolase [Haloechinothrix alba]